MTPSETITSSSATVKFLTAYPLAFIEYLLKTPFGLLEATHIKKHLLYSFELA